MGAATTSEPLVHRRFQFSLGTLLSLTLLLASLVALYCTFMQDRASPLTIDGLRVWDARFSPDETAILVCYNDGTCRLFDLQFNVLLKKRFGGLEGGRFLPDGRILVSTRNTTYLLDGTTGNEILKYDGCLSCISPDAKTIATSEHNHVHLWDLDGKETSKFTGHTGYYVRTVAFSPDGARLVSGGDDAVRVWDAKSGAQISQIPIKDEYPLISFSPDGQSVLTSFGQAQVWDADTGKERFSLYVKQIGGAWFTPSGKEILTVGRLSGSLVWPAAPDAKPRRVGAYYRYNSVWPGRELVVNGECAYAEVWDAEANSKQGYFSTWRSAGIMDATKSLNLVLTWGGDSPIFARAFEPEGADIWSREPGSQAWQRFRLPQVRWLFYASLILTIALTFATFWTLRRDRMNAEAARFEK